jgi:MFS family permease
MPDLPPQPQPHDALGALRLPNYRRFAAGFLASSTGLQMLATAIAWEVYQRTNDPLDLGWIGIARALPVVLLALPAGHVIDHFDRRRVLVATQLAMGLGAAALAYASQRPDTPLIVYYLLLGLMGCARAFNGPSRATLLPLLVPEGRFHNAVTWNVVIFHFSATVGPVLAGVMLGSLGVYWPVYGATAVGCLLFSLLGGFVRPREMPRVTGPFSWGSMLAGAGHIRREKTILAALTLDLFAVLLGGATALLPVYASDILHVGEERYGLLRAATPMGAVLMSLAMTQLPPFRRAGAALLGAVAAYGVCIITFGFSTVFWLSFVALFASGAVDNISVVVRHVLVQVRTPNHLRGRVSAINSVFIESSNELGAFESGAAAKLFAGLTGSAVAGAVWSVVTGGIGTLLVVAGVAAAWPQIRSLGRLREDDGPPIAPPDPAAGSVAK